MLAWLAFYQARKFANRQGHNHQGRTFRKVEGFHFNEFFKESCHGYKALWCWCCKSLAAGGVGVWCEPAQLGPRGPGRWPVRGKNAGRAENGEPATGSRSRQGLCGRRRREPHEVRGDIRRERTDSRR